MTAEELAEALNNRWYELEHKFRHNQLNFDEAYLNRFATFEEFLSDLPQGIALRLIMTGH